MVGDGVGSTLRMGAVRFPPGARTASHSHALGQALHVTEGLGVVQTRDGQVLTLHPGDTVVSPAGEGHWHGALDRFMTHLVQLFLSARTVRGPSDRRSGRRRCAGSRR